MEAKASASPGTAIATTSPPRANGTVDPRIAGLRRMRLVATLLLALMAVIFRATSVVKVDWLWSPYLLRFTEADMVGACADWFAIVALFRRPFGLPIPHTGIVPHNKDRIGGALGRFMSANFLSPSVLARRLEKIGAVEFLLDWL